MYNAWRQKFIGLWAKRHGGGQWNLQNVHWIITVIIQIVNKL